MPVVLIVEDEVDLNNLIRTQLQADGHTVYQAFDGPAALRLVAAHTPQLVILDWMLPGMDGLAVCRQIRRDHLMPILMLTARNEEIDRVLGLEVGADDYVVKPFSMRELLARVRAMLRRVALDSQGAIAATPSPAASDQDANDTVPPAPEPIIRGPLRVNLADHSVSLDGREVDLTPKEFDLLALLAGHPGRAFSREFLLERLWGYDYDGVDRTVDTHIVRLRKKLGPLGEHIVTVWGVGYRFTA
ncbi:MAG: Phosphate regulon transcriptional regulatory protein PhoB (SphR) [Ktedonobacterales bacterium]|nr:MAG: Phosphate regulon transcriptional regulatory protein PhoB (SphR) [Ktedonobacterales bacterium]